MIEEISEKQKPEGWPANAIECQLENIQYQVKKFKLNPKPTPIPIKITIAKKILIFFFIEELFLVELSSILIILSIIFFNIIRF